MIEREGDGFRLQYGGLQWAFHIESRARKSLSITVHPDGSLQVLAPLGADVETVLARVDNRAAWIAKQWRTFSAARARVAGARHEYLSGETHWYLGHPFRLKIVAPDDESADEAAGVQLRGSFLHIVAPAPHDPTSVARALEGWYRAQAQEVFPLWLEKCLCGARSLQMKAPPRIEIRKMQKRWGSCTPSGKILLNLDLVKMPVDCIEYVLFHELCHLQEPHHGPQFYALLRRFLPDWKERKAKLEEWGQKI